MHDEHSHCVYEMPRSRVGRFTEHASTHNLYISACRVSPCYGVLLLSFCRKPKAASE